MTAHCPLPEFATHRGGHALLVYGDRNAARRVALRACVENVERGGRSLFLQQRVISIDDTALLCSEGSENVFLGVFESLGEISPLILRIKPSIAVIDPVNGSGAGWISQRRLASDLFEVIGTAERISVWLILLCEMMDWNGDSRPRLYSTLRKFCDHEMEVQTSRQL